MQLAPYAITTKKAHFGPLDEDRAFKQAVQSARGIDVPVPVLFRGKVIGGVMGSRPGDPTVYWTRDTSLWKMAGFPNYADINQNVDLGKRLQLHWYKAATTSPVTSNWYDLWPVGITPAVGAYGGAAFTSVRHNDTEIGAIWHGGDVSSETKHIVSLFAFTSAQTPTIWLYDRVLTYEACTFNTNANQAFTTTLTAQRYISAGQRGMKIMTTCQTTLGATAANITQLVYTDNDGNDSQSMPTTQTVSHVVSAAAPTATRGARIVSPSTTTGTVPWGPFMPLAVGDCGVQKLADWTTSAANTGTLCFVLGAPLAVVPVVTAQVATQVDQVVASLGLQRVYDGACLSVLAFFSTSTGASIIGGIDVVWS